MSDNESTMSRDDVERMVKVEQASVTLLNTFTAHEERDAERHAELKQLIVDQSIPGLAIKFPKLTTVIGILVTAKVLGIDLAQVLKVISAVASAQFP